MKKSISMFLAFLIIMLSFSTFSFAVSKTTDVPTSLEETIEEYFNFRASSFENPKAKSISPTNIEISDEVLADEQSRRGNIIEKMENIDKIYVVEAISTPRITRCAVIDSGNVQADIYEWTWLKYNCDNGEKATDELGFATLHTMTLAPTENGYRIKSDSFFEGNTTGTISSNYIELEVDDEELLNYSQDSKAHMQRNGESYSADDAISYADSYVEDDEGNLGSQNTDYYNISEYGYLNNNDCANFVSQCLYAGGFEDDYGDGQDITSTKQWWFDRPCDGDSMAKYCPPAWRSVSYLTSYLKNDGYSSANATKSNVSAGNPVYVSGHIVICVGENSNGTPVINGHTNDMYHCPWGWVSTDGAGTNAKTILIA